MLCSCRRATPFALLNAIADPDSEINNGVVTSGLDKSSVKVETISPTLLTMAPTGAPTIWTQPTPGAPPTARRTIQPTQSYPRERVGWTGPCRRCPCCARTPFPTSSAQAAPWCAILTATVARADRLKCGKDWNLCLGPSVVSTVSAS